MKYNFLRRFCGTPDRYSLPHGHNTFMSGIPYYEALGSKGLGMYCITLGTTTVVLFNVVVRNNKEEWRKKLDKHTSSAEWDIIRKGK